MKDVSVKKGKAFREERKASRGSTHKKITDSRLLLLSGLLLDDDVLLLHHQQ